MAEPVYGIDDFPDDDSLWRVEWIGGVGYNTSVPSDPRITVCLTQLPPGETNPLSARARFRRPRLLVARGPIWFGVPYRDALKFTFAQLPGNNGVDVGVVHNDESRSAPADRTSWQELQRSCHGRFFAPDGGKTLPS